MARRTSAAPARRRGWGKACPLTAREFEILRLVAGGASNARAGRLLGITERTVKNQLTGVMEKLDAPDRTAAVVIACRAGWLDPRAVRIEARRPPGDDA